MECSNPLEALRSTKWRKHRGRMCWYPVLSPPPAAPGAVQGTAGAGGRKCHPKVMNSVERGGDQVGRAGNQLSERSKAWGECDPGRKRKGAVSPWHRRQVPLSAVCRWCHCLENRPGIRWATAHPALTQPRKPAPRAWFDGRTGKDHPSLGFILHSS